MTDMKKLQELLQSSMGGDSNAEKEAKPSFFWKNLSITSILSYNPKNLPQDLKVIGNSMSKSLLQSFDAIIKYIAIGKPQHEDPKVNEVMNFIKSPLLVGIYICIMFPIAGIFWAAVTPIGKCIQTSGQLASIHERQMLEIPAIDNSREVKIKQILVKEGDFVKAGQLLAVLDDEQILKRITETKKLVLGYDATGSKYKSLLELSFLDNTKIVTIEQLRNALAKVKNIKLKFTPMLLTEQDMKPFVNEIIKDTKIGFKTVKNNIILLLESLITSQIIFENKKAQMEAQLSEKNSILPKQQILENLKQKELNFNEGYLSLDEYTNQILYLQGELSRYGELEYRLLDNASHYESTKTQIWSQISRHMQEAYVSLIRTEAEGSRYAQQLQELENSLEKTKIYANLDGKVNKIFRKMLNASFSTAQNPFLFDITPMQDFILTCNIPHNYIGSVVPGTQVKITFVVFKTSINYDFTGTITYVGSDLDYMSMTQQKQPQYYKEFDDSQKQQGPMFIAKIKFDEEELKNLISQYSEWYILSAGMPAQVAIKLPDESYMRYLLSPMTNLRNFAFKQ